jgi:uncharacterized protein
LSSLTLVVKVAERCNLACTYCYMYEGADQTWRDRPRLLSDELAALLLDRVEEYLYERPDAGVTLELHGGEPLLWGRKRTRSLARAAASIDAERVDVTVQTNGTLLDERWLELFTTERIAFAISCDGPPALHDRRRPTIRGRSSSAETERAIRLALETDGARELFGGVLAVADLVSDPADVLRWFHELGVREVDLLLPDLPRSAALDAAPAALRYLIEAFDVWVALDDPSFRVRFLAEFALGVLGVPSELDYLGGPLDELIVVESDGSLQLLDVLRVCDERIAHTGMHLRTQSLAEAAERAAAAVPPAPDSCRACPAFTACGGGYLPHRFDGDSFDNPSGYCDALLGLYGHVLKRLRRATPEHAWRETRASTPLRIASRGASRAAGASRARSGARARA